MNGSSNSNLNERYRREFVNELPERLQAIENLLMKLENGASRHASLEALFRHIHSIKGSSVTFGLQILSAICHPYEELIYEAEKADNISGEFINLALEYVDLLRNTLKSIADGQEDYEPAERKLTELHKRSFLRPFSVGIAVNSRMLKESCSQVAGAQDARVVIFDDSLTALQRVMTEPFSVIIASSQVYPVRGEALIAALKLSYRHAEGLKTIFVTSSKEKAQHINRAVDPDCILLRDKHFLSNLHNLLANLRQHSMRT